MKSEPVTLEITSLSHDGRGIAYINGKTTFVSGAMTGEQVIGQIFKKNSRFNEANTLEVLRSAPDRVKPACAHYGVCGGCSMQHFHTDYQIQFKQKMLLEQLEHFGKVKPERILPPLTTSHLGYRRKARLGVRFVRKKEKVLVGFREKFSNFLTDVKECPVLHATVGTRITELSELIASLSIYEHFPQIEIAAGDDHTALVFRVMKDLTPEDKEKLIVFGQQFNLHIYLQANPPTPLEKLYPADTKQTLSYSLPQYSLTMEFHPLDFIQVNGETNHLMIQQALQLLDPQQDENVLDLFCGLGNFTLPLAKLSSKVIGVEGSHEMVTRATNNARLNNISNAKFYMMNLMEPIPNVSWMKQKYAKILLDPPRTGAKEIINFFPNFNAKRIVYVSCNPATLARDAGELVHQQHYVLKQIGLINMFPHTSHIEAIALFEKK